MSKNEVVKLTRTRLRSGALCGLIFVQVGFRGDIALLRDDGVIAAIYADADHLAEVSDGTYSYIALMRYPECIVVDPNQKGANFLRPIAQGDWRYKDGVLRIKSDNDTAEYKVTKHYILCWEEAEAEE
jgi:hypothetical protein